MRHLPNRRTALKLAAAGGLSAILAPWPTPVFAGRTPLIAAAASLRFVMPELLQAIRADKGHTLEVTYGSSGNLRRQIERGAPFALFFSADEAHARAVETAGLTDGDGAIYAVGRLSIFIPHGSPLKARGDLSDLEAALDDGRLTRFAIANPAHAPYGRRAAEVLEHRGLMKRMSKHLLVAENVAQAAQFAATGGADGGLIAHSLAISPQLISRGRSDKVAAAWHQPLKQRAVVLRGATPSARAFFDFVLDQSGRRILERHGLETSKTSV